MASILKKLIQKLQINRATGFGTATMIWRIVAGPISMLIVMANFSTEMQGYYYTFSSLIALQVFVQLGWGVVIIQFASHEWGQLKLTEKNGITGDTHALARLASLAKLAFSWYIPAGVVMAFGLGISGFYFFNSAPNTENIEWMQPWIVLAVMTGLDICLSPFWNLLEGCNQVSQLYAFRMIQGIVNALLVWSLILMGAGLWALPLAATLGLLLSVGYLIRYYRRFFVDLRQGYQGVTLSWRKELWPMQWRVALSYISNYFMSSFFTPLVFQTSGAAEAGRFGMTWNIVLTVAGLATMWGTTRAPQFGILISQGEYKQLHDLLKKVWIAASMVLIAGMVAVEVVILALFQLQHPFSTRFLDPVTVSILVLGAVAAQFTHPIMIYLRAYRKEPLMAMWVAAALLMAFLAWVLGARYGTIGVVSAYAIVSGITVPWVLWIWRSFEKKNRSRLTEI